MRTRVALAFALLATSLGTIGLQAQTGPVLRVETEDGSVESVPVAMDRGYAAVPASVMSALGWRQSLVDGSVSFSAPSGSTISLAPSSPFFTTGPQW